jgi:hypothetical protein
MSEPNIPFPNIIGLKVTIGDLEIFPRNATFDNEQVLFQQITIDEDMFAESIFGSIEFVDPSPNLSYANQLNFDNVVKIQHNISDSETETFEFDIVDIQVLTDLASKRLTGAEGRPVKIIVRFASKVFLYQNFNTAYMQDFIGKISQTGQDREEFIEGVDLPPSDEIMDGFVQDIMAKVQPDTGSGYFKQLKADPTFNAIWYKHDPFFYPFSKSANVSKFSQIMNYICEYACYAKNPKAVNFFFWEDLYNWNFRCIESLIEEYEQKKYPHLSFSPVLDENAANAIVSFEVINAVVPPNLLASGAIFSEYLRTKPNWGDIYSNFIDTNGELSNFLFKYEYKDDGQEWKKISKNPVKDYPGYLTTTYRITDTNYGYYSEAYNRTDLPWWNFYNGYNSYLDDPSFTVEAERMEVKYWRAQFDFCELPGTWLRKIYKEIKWPLVESRQLYAEEKRLKKKWEVYKNSVCCVRPVPETFFAVLTGAEKIYGSNGTINYEVDQDIEKDSSGVWKYTWTEVEFWPRDQAASILSDPFYQIIEFEDNSFPFVFIKPQGAAQGMAPPELNIEEFPDTRAYNLNEILNSRIPDDFELYGGDAGPWTLMMNPGISDGLGVTANKGSLSSYPNNFAMMPVGKFRVLTGDCPPAFDDDGTQPFTDDFYFGGRIVQMYRIPKETLTGIQGISLASSDIFTQKTSIPTDNLYLFDVENGHDGLCADC